MSLSLSLIWSSPTPLLLGGDAKGRGEEGDLALPSHLMAAAILRWGKCLYGGGGEGPPSTPTSPRYRKEDVVQIDRSAADPRILPSLVAVLRLGGLELRIAVAWVMVATACAGAKAKLQMADAEGMLAELLHLVADEEEKKPADLRAVDAGLAALDAVSSPRRVWPQIVVLGAVPALGRLLVQPSTPPPAAERALRLMEVASTCTEGRAVICGDPAAVVAVVGRMTRVPAEAAERMVAVLWTVCHLFRDRRAQEVATAGGGLAKVLLLMQSNCSPEPWQMGGDLLKILRANSKGGLPSYDSKTTHITPF